MVSVSRPNSSYSDIANVRSILFNVLWVAKINRDKANGKHDQYIGYGDDREPSFRLVM
jgi:hypothetical protein